MSAIWDGGPTGATHRFVLIALADNANDDGECWPSVATISRKTGICVRSVRLSLRHLETEGWLKTQFSAARAGANKYQIIVLTPASHAPGIKCPPASHAEHPGITCRPPQASHAAEPSSITINEPSLFGEDAPKPKKQTRKCQMPDGWVPSERNISDAKAKQFSEQEIDDEADKFRNHHTAHANAFANWDAAWRTWLGNARKFAPRGNMAGGAAPSRHGQGSSIASIVARRRMVSDD